MRRDADIPASGWLKPFINQNLPDPVAADGWFVHGGASFAHRRFVDNVVQCSLHHFECAPAAQSTANPRLAFMPAPSGTESGILPVARHRPE